MQEIEIAEIAHMGHMPHGLLFLKKKFVLTNRLTWANFKRRCCLRIVVLWSEIRNQFHIEQG